MAVQPTQPQPSNALGKLFTIGGAVVGGVYGGGAPGAATGASLGNMAGGFLQQPAIAPVTTPESQGMQMRQDAIDQDPLRQIQAAQAAAKKLSPDQMPEVRKAFDNAIAIAKQNQEFGRG